MKKNLLFCFFILFSLQVSFAPLFAAESSIDKSSKNETWTLAAMEFTFTRQESLNESAAQAAKVLPSLVLERISSGTIRQIPEKEILDRKIKDLQKERISLFLQLSKESQARDALFLSAESKKSLQKSLKEENEKIAEIENKIKKNLESEEKEIQESLKKIHAEEKNGFIPEDFLQNDSDKIKETGENDASIENEGFAHGPKEKKGFFRPFSLPFFHRGEKNNIAEESIAIYKSSPDTLFKPSDKAAQDGFSSWNFESEVSAQNINGLLSGKITSYGGYCSVTAELRTYPGAKIAGAVTEVGMLSDLIPLASRIAAGLAPKISNTLPVRIEFDISPRKALDNLVVTVDGVVQQMLSKSRAGNDAWNSILVNAGIHRIVIESAGYEQISLLYSFSDESAFTVKAELAPDVKNEIHIRLKKYSDGIFYANALGSAKVSPENPYGALTVNGKRALAVFKAETQKSAAEILSDASKNDMENQKSQDEKKKNKSGKLEPRDESNIAFVQIPSLAENSAFDGAYLFADAKPYDRAADIDRRRRMMYLAYTGLICSLPWTFYNLGNFTAANNAYSDSDRRAGYDDVKSWQQKNYISLGVTAAFGAWTVFELVRYLRSADKVLPAKAKIDRKAAEILQETEKLDKSELNFESKEKIIE